MKRNYKSRTTTKEGNNYYVTYLAGKKVRVENNQQYGIDSSPVEQGRGVIIDTGAGNSNKVLLGGGGFHNDLKVGEVIVYNQKKESLIKLNDEGKIDIRNKKQNLNEVLTSLKEISEQIKTNTTNSVNSLLPSIAILNAFPETLRIALAAGTTAGVLPPVTIGEVTGIAFAQVATALQNLLQEWNTNVAAIENKINTAENKINELLE